GDRPPPRHQQEGRQRRDSEARRPGREADRRRGRATQLRRSEARMTSPLYPDELPTWRDGAACLGVDPDLFFPPQGGATNGAEAKQICGGCPVQAECLDYAVTTAQKYGIWGGTNERERREIRKQRGLIVRTESACGTLAGYRRHQNRKIGRA